MSKRVTGPVEAKTAWATTATLIVSGVFAFDATYHWFPPPTAAQMTILVTAVTAVVGWVAPHTHRPDLVVRPPRQAYAPKTYAGGGVVPGPVSSTLPPGTKVTYGTPGSQPPATTTGGTR